MMLVIYASLGWTSSPLGHTIAPAVTKRQCMLPRQRMLPVVLKEGTADADVLMVLVRTLERIEAKIDYLEGKVDNLGAQGLEEKWRIERLEGKVRLRRHTGTILCSPAHAHSMDAGGLSGFAAPEALRYSLRWRSGRSAYTRGR